MDKLKQAAMAAYLNKRVKEDRARLAAGNGRAYDPEAIRATSTQREPMSFTTRQTRTPRQRHMYPTVSRPADTMLQPSLGQKPGGAQTVSAPRQPVAGLPFMGANDLRKNIGQTQLDAFGGTVYNAAADAINRRNGENLFTLPGERDKLNADLAEVQSNIDRMEAFYREHGMHEDQLAYESQLAARDTLNKRIAGIDSELGKVQQVYDELEQHRPDSFTRQGLDQYQGIYGQYSKGYPGFGMYNAENIYDAGLKSPETADITRSMMQQDARNLPGTMQSLSDMIARFEEAGMGDTQEVANMRKRLEDLNRRSDQLDYTGLRDNADFRAVVDGAKANGYKPGDKHADILSAVLDPEAYEKKHFMANLMPFSPYVGPKNAAKYMTDEERDTFLYLWQTQGEDAAYQYFESMIPTGNQRYAERIRRTGEIIGEASPIGGMAFGTLGNLASVPLNILGMAETGVNALTGQRTDPYGMNFTWNSARTGLQTGSREAVVNRFKEDGKETTASKLAGLGFDVVSTTLDNAAMALAYGPLAPYVMALSSASSSTSDALIRSNGESLRSFLYGAGAGVAEYATEKIPMDQIGDMLAGKMKGIGAVLAHSLTEAPGEMLSTILSEVSDRAIMDAYSGYELSVQAMMQQGMSEEEARLHAERDFWIEVGYSGMLGWLSASGSALVSQGMARVTGQGTAPEAQQPVQQETLPVQPAEAKPGSMLPQEAWLALPDDAAVADGQTVQEAAAVQEADAVRQTVSEAAADFATEAAADQAAVDQSIAGNNADMTAFVPETTAAVQDETVREAGQLAARHAPQQAYYDSREEVGKRFRKLAKPLVEQTRDLWKRIQQIEDPILRTLKETAYEMLFQPLWDASINEQFYIDYPHLRPKQDVERRKRLKELAEAQMVSLQGDDAEAKGQAKGAAIVKQWDATLDGDTRDTHRKPDGQIREVDEPFEMDGKEAQYPGDFNDPAEDCHRDFKEKYLKAAEKPANFAKPLKNKEESGIRNGRTIAQRSMSNRLRTSPLHILTESEIESILIDADTLKIPRTVLRFNQKKKTGFYDDEGLIFVRGDILPDVNSTELRDRLSQRAVLAHEYYGHYLSHPSNFRIGDWRDEFRASYKAAINAPGLSDEERRMLMLDAYDRAKEAGVSVKYNKKARELIHGND